MSNFIFSTVIRSSTFVRAWQGGGCVCQGSEALSVCVRARARVSVCVSKVHLFVDPLHRAVGEGCLIYHIDEMVPIILGSVSQAAGYTYKQATHS